MRLHVLAAGLLLATVATVPVLAQEADPVDLVAEVFIGFADGATVQVMGNESATVTRSAPGSYTGTAAGSDFTFVASELEACVYQGQFALGADTFTIIFDLNKVDSITFENAEPGNGFITYKVQLTGAEDAVQVLAADGTRSNAGLSSPIGTSIPVEDLDAAAAALLETCSG